MRNYPVSQHLTPKKKNNKKAVYRILFKMFKHVLVSVIMLKEYTDVNSFDLAV